MGLAPVIRSSQVFNLAAQPLQQESIHASPKVTNAQSMSQPQAKSYLSQIGSGLYSGFQHAAQMYTTFANYHQTNKPADTQECLKIHDRLNTLAEGYSDNTLIEIDTRIAHHKNQLDVLNKLPSGTRKRPEVQDAVKKTNHEIAKNKQWGQRINAVEDHASQVAEQLINNPTERQLRYSNIQLEKTRQAFDQIHEDMNTDKQTSAQSRREVKKVTKQAQSLLDNQKSIQILAASLHLKKGWSNLSALSHDFANYCIRQEKPAIASLEQQAATSASLHDSLKNMVTLHEMIKPAHEAAEHIQTMVANPKSLNGPSYNSKLLLSQLKRTQQMEKQLHQSYAKLEQHAAAAVSYATRSPQEHTQRLAAELVSKFEATTNAVYDYKDETKGTLRDFFKAAQVLAGYVRHEPLEQLTAKALQEI